MAVTLADAPPVPGARTDALAAVLARVRSAALHPLVRVRDQLHLVAGVLLQPDGRVQPDAGAVRVPLPDVDRVQVGGDVDRRRFAQPVLPRPDRLPQLGRSTVRRWVVGVLQTALLCRFRLHTGRFACRVMLAQMPQRAVAVGVVVVDLERQGSDRYRCTLVRCWCCLPR